VADAVGLVVTTAHLSSQKLRRSPNKSKQVG
jgi:hypothetical protein